MAAVQVLRVDGSEETHKVERRALLPQIYQLIGCDCIDTVNLRDGRVMLVDDVGMLVQKPINGQATRIYHGIYSTPYPIVGDVAIVLDEEFA